jgi:hypothetical protein
MTAYYLVRDHQQFEQAHCSPIQPVFTEIFKHVSDYMKNTLKQIKIGHMKIKSTNWKELKILNA